MATGKTATQLIRLLGVCVPTSKQNAAKIRVKQLDFDNHLLMYFNKHIFVYASDPKKLCKTGDTVLIRNLPTKLTRLITHEVLEVIYPLGDMIDPISGKKIVAGRYREHINEDAKMFGKLDSAFDYDKVEKRGSLEGIRDFSNKETYIKYTDDPNRDDPYAVDPH